MELLGIRPYPAHSKKKYSVIFLYYVTAVITEQYGNNIAFEIEYW